MKLAYSGIHKNVGFVVQHCGGYDKEYHIKKVSDNTNIDEDNIRDLFKFSLRSNLLDYIELLEAGVSFPEVMKMVNDDRELSNRRLRNAFIPMASLLASIGSDYPIGESFMYSAKHLLK